MSRPRRNRLRASRATSRRSSSAVSAFLSLGSPSSVKSSATSESSSEIALTLPQRRHHALPHFRGGLARKGDRENVARRDAGFEQTHVTIDEDARLAGAGRGLERDVTQRIDREASGALIRGLLERLGRGI